VLYAWPATTAESEAYLPSATAACLQVEVRSLTPACAPPPPPPSAALLTRQKRCARAGIALCQSLSPLPANPIHPTSAPAALADWTSFSLAP